jgi:hypothetical protein
MAIIIETFRQSSRLAILGETFRKTARHKLTNIAHFTDDEHTECMATTVGVKAYWDRVFSLVAILYAAATSLCTITNQLLPGHPQAAKIAFRNSRRTGAHAATVLYWWTSAHAGDTAVIALVTEAFEVCGVPAWGLQHDGPAQ